MRKLAGLGLVVVLALAASVAWNNSPETATQTQAVPEAVRAISPHDLDLHSELLRLPAERTADAF